MQEDPGTNQRTSAVWGNPKPDRKWLGYLLTANQELRGPRVEIALGQGRKGGISKMASLFHGSICIGLVVSYLRGDKNE